MLGVAWSGEVVAGLVDEWAWVDCYIAATWVNDESMWILAEDGWRSLVSQPSCLE
jgi:hypothetical protein